MSIHRARSRLLTFLFVMGMVVGSDTLRALDPSKALTQYQCRSWTRQDGLPASAVNAVVQAKDGFLWVGTQKGLVRYDGIEFKTLVLPETPLFNNQIITCLATAADGGLWFGVAEGGFGAYHPDRGFSIVTNETWIVPRMATAAIREANDGALWVGCLYGTARLISAEGGRNPILTQLANSTMLFEDSRQRIWVGTVEEGLFYWQGGRLVGFPDESLKKTSVLALAEDSEGRIWVGTSAGLRCYDARFRRVDIPPLYTEVRALLVDRQDVLWIGTSGDGLVRFSQGNSTSLLKTGGLAHDFVTSLWEDREGSLWVGTRQGLTQLSDVKFPLFTKSEGLLGGDLHSVASAGQRGLLIATSRGFCRFDGHTATNFSNEVGFSNRYLQRVFQCRDGDIYVINGDKKIEVVFGGKVVARYAHTNGWPTAFAEDRDGVVVSIGKGLFRASRQGLQPFAFNEGKAPVFYWIRDLFSCPDGSLLVASANGIFRIRDGVFRQWSAPEGLKTPDVSFVCEDRRGVIWAASALGIVRVEDLRVRCFSRDDGLPDNFILSVVPDVPGWLWVHSSLGLFRVSQESLEKVADGRGRGLECVLYEGSEVVKTIDTMKVEQTVSRTSDGMLWFPATQGVIRVDPANLVTNPVAPLVRIESARVNGWECMGRGRKVAPPGNGELKVRYTAASFIAPTRVRFRSWLEGYEPNWVDVGVQRSAFYTNLKPGSYRFHVRACNADGVWAEAEDTLQVTLRPHFYQTIWFEAVCALLGLAAMAGSGALLQGRQTRRHRQLELANEHLEAVVRERTSQLVEASRRAGMAEVATSVLHNIGNVLNSVNVSASLVRERVTLSDADRLGKVVALLRPFGDDPRPLLTDSTQLRRIIVFLEAFKDFLTAEKTGLLKELNCLAESVGQIKEIVAMQQAHAGVGGVEESVTPAELFEHALRIHAAAFEGHAISIIREFDPIAPMTVDKHKTLQILLSLLDNATHAFKESPPQGREVTVRLSLAKGSRVRFDVGDNGVGISRENLTRIFGYGFTTRQGGHGFSLHSAALAAMEMGGSLVASSDGPGHGATFTLELPLKPAAATGPFKTGHSGSNQHQPL